MKFFDRFPKPKSNIDAEDKLRAVLTEKQTRDQDLLKRATGFDQEIAAAYAKGALEAPQELARIQSQIEELRIKREGRK